ncbi:6-phosphogluconate dehydrogenase [Colletotrichum karsti]|uniref:phosphogluconate dehydrogenase (NADP(+)-dependent, decarboxylating) n=1 Tax=Colletotrichum karsti TaxID=1095194 RepID=A0A9P6LF40_9PEZI|nr:6-phosphogluconate dehydrogenase [Colletotrichum karsti]KAF9871093.1 6-phosphogluconate dehydrogenase [Colletotrichum karsti]
MADSSELPPDINRGPEILAICGTLVVIFAEMMVIIPEVQHGGGRHFQYIEPKENIVKGLHLNFVTQPLCLIGLCLAKVSVGLFLLRMTPSARMRNFILGTIIFTILSATGNLLTVFFQCRPLAFTWDTSIEGGECIPPGNLKFAAFFNSGVSVFTDLLFALLPIPMLWKVQLNWKVKSAVIGVLSLGIFATVAAIVKISFLPNYGKHGDFLFDSSDITIWTTVEICTAIVAASIPCLKPLFKAILAGSSAKYASKYNNNTHGYIRNEGTNRSGVPGNGSGNIEMFSRSRHTTAINSGFRSKMDSEESIVGPQGSAQSDGITKTMQVSVYVDEGQQKNPKDLIGVVGVGSMGAAMSLLFAENAKENVDKLRHDAMNLGLDDRITGRESYEDLCETVKAESKPGVFVFSTPHGSVGDEAVQGLLSGGGLGRGDIILDCANEQWQATERRQRELRPRGVHYIGCGVSGGYQSARSGPSFSPGGDPEIVHQVLPFLEKLAAKDRNGRPCTGYVGPGGSGHFVKMIHNGIEQGMMSILAEVWAIMVRGLGMSYEDVGKVFKNWNESGPLHDCFLIRIGAEISNAKDDHGENPLGHIRDKVVQDVEESEGTGNWTCQEAIGLHQPAATIVSAHLFRYASAFAGQRKHNKDAAGEATSSKELDVKSKEEFLSHLQMATYFGFITCFAQGMDIIQAQDKKMDWKLKYRDILQLWRGGCIIQADGIIDVLEKMYSREDRNKDDGILANIEVAKELSDSLLAAKQVIIRAIEADLCVPALSQSLEYYKYSTSTELPTQFMEAELDYFGKHMFDRKEDPFPGKPKTGEHHYEWKPAVGKRDK